MPGPLHEVCCASLPAAALPVLAGLRGRPGVDVALANDRTWVRWQAGDEEVLRRVLPVAGVELYVHQDGRWHRFGRHLPALDFPQGLDYRPLHQVLFPAAVLPVPPRPPELKPHCLTLVPDDRPRRTAALECGLAELARWADALPEVRLASLRAARCRGRVLVLGERLPAVPSGRRYWGELLLVPLGFRTEPGLPAEAIRASLGLTGDDLLVLGDGRAEVVPSSALQPLTRAGLRLATGEVAIFYPHGPAGPAPD
jgi:hypothetical protein